MVLTATVEIHPLQPGRQEGHHKKWRLALMSRR